MQLGTLWTVVPPGSSQVQTPHWDMLLLLCTMSWSLAGLLLTPLLQVPVALAGTEEVR